MTKKGAQDVQSPINGRQNHKTECKTHFNANKIREEETDELQNISKKMANFLDKCVSQKTVHVYK